MASNLAQLVLCVSSKTSNLCFGWIFKIFYRATAEHYSWSQEKHSVSNRVGRALRILEADERKVQTRAKEETYIILAKSDPTGHGFTSKTENIAKYMLNNNNILLFTLN